jgi:hypothetical protein
MPKQIIKINSDYEVLLAEYNELRLEQEAVGESTTTLIGTINDLVAHNKELKKENNWYKQELARGHIGARPVEMIV